MQFPSVPLSGSAWLALTGWLYLLTNALRVFTYIPQIVVVWRCTDGALTVSLLTWGSWVLSNVTATLYGVLVVQDGLFVTISVVNLIGCAAVTLIAARRRVQWHAKWRKSRVLPAHSVRRGG